MRFLLLCLLSVQFLLAQEYNPIAPPNSYQSVDNPYYWANKKPYADYWQQDVYYKIYATINEKTDIIEGKEQLVYWNNSPDTLKVVYFHLYQNAFQPGSYYDNLYHNNGASPKYGKYESQGLGTVINSIKVSGKEVKTTIDNTIMIVHLNDYILPHTGVQFDIDFDTYYDVGGVRRRMKTFMSYGRKQYNGCHWYPRIAVYDHKFSWTTDQHLGREFYGDFGTFDVTLNFANDYIVAATGKLLNEEEALPADLRAKLDLKNFANKPYGERPSTIIPYEEGKRKEWHFYAENIHDFAFTANPHYRIGEAEWLPEGDPNKAIKVYSFVQEPHASGWQNAADYTAKVIQVYSEDIGLYAYHKMIVADARDGMEYPMITMDNGSDPGYRGLLAHEVGHNWFYGMMNNNETYRAFMDEGFTQFLTSWSQEKIDGKYVATNSAKSKYINKFREAREVREDEIYYGYIRDASLGKDPQLNTHSDGFNGALGQGGGYGHVYSKTGAMLYSLQYTLGDDLFLEAMQYYFSKWSFCHPYPEDFRQSIIEYTKTDLNWFFDQWLETSKTIDYKVAKVKRVKGEDNSFEIKIKRKGRMQMPIDFQVEDKEGRLFDFHIPNQYFQKETDATILPKWTGWDNLHPSYVAKVSIPEAYEAKKVKIRNVKIDPSWRLADANVLNNSKKDKVEWAFDSHIWNYPDWKKYRIYYRPDLWWNAYDGIKLGWHLNGNYLNRKHLFELSAWYNTRLLQGNLPQEAIDQEGNKYYTNDRINFNFWYKTALDKFMPNTNLELKARFLDGLALGQFGLNKSFKKLQIYAYLKSMCRKEANDANYLIYPNEWTMEKRNASLNFGLLYPISNRKGNYSAELSLLARSSVTKDLNYQYAELSYVEEVVLGGFNWKTRFYTRLGTKFTPIESSLYFAGANPEQLVENKYTRSSGFFPNSWIGAYGPETNHFQFGGGLNMRGYAGYYLVEEDVSGKAVAAYRGNSGVAINSELGFDRWIKWKKLPKLKQRFDVDTYLFADLASISYLNSNKQSEWSELRADAGIGASFTIKRWWKLSNIKPLTIRFDVPFIVSHAPAAESNVKFRWVLGINRAF
ncbi:MAG: M1 family peptidase [Chitinophagales bacterium]|nr:M1 family peptidase [Chitinophagales bacterium]